MPSQYNSKKIISSFVEEDCQYIQHYLTQCGLHCEVFQVLPTSATAISRHNWGCKIKYNKSDESDEIIDKYENEHSTFFNFK